MRKIIFGIVALWSLGAAAQSRTVEADYIRGQNYVRNFVINPDAEVNTRGVTVSGATVTRIVGPTSLEGTANFAVTLNNNVTDTVTWELKDREPIYNGLNCEARVQYSSTAMGSNVSVQVLQGSSVVAESLPLSNTGAFMSALLVVLNFPCSTNPSTIVLRNATGNTGSSTMRVDAVNYSRATNVGTVAQAEIEGAVIWPGVGSCQWSRTSSATFADFAADADCTLPAGANIVGTASAPATRIPAITFANLKGGRYKFTATGGFSSPTGAQCSWRFSDGTTSTAAQPSGGATGGNYSNAIVGIMDLAAGTRTISIQGTGTLSSQTCDIVNVNATTTTLTIIAERLPTSSEQVFRPDALGVRWTAYTPTGTWTANTSYTGRFRCDGDTLEVSALASLTGAPTAAQLSIGLPSGFTIDTSKVVSTDADRSIFGSGVALDAAVQNYSPLQVRYGSTTDVRVFATNAGSTYAIGAAVDAGIPFTFGSGDSVMVSFRVPVTSSSPCSTIRAPLLVGSVTSNSAGLERVERARIAWTAGVPSVTRQSGNWIASLTDSAPGQVIINFVSGIWSSPPDCVCVGEDNTNLTCKKNSDASVSSQALITLRPTTISGVSAAAEDMTAVSVICMGTR